MSRRSQTRATAAAPPPAPRSRLPPAPGARALGALLLAVLAVLALTGLGLSLRGAPDAASAHADATRLAAGAGGFVRALHAWAATALVLLLLVHVSAAWLGSAGRLTRRRVWTGAGLAAVVLGASVTGTVLPFDQRGWEAYQHLAMGLQAIGLGESMNTPDSARLGLVFLLHVLAVPALLVGLLAVHVRTRDRREDARRLWRLVQGAARPAGALVAAVAVAALLLPPRLGPAPVPGLTVSRPEWPLLWLLPVQDRLGPAGLWALPIALGLAALIAAFGGRWPVTRRRAVLALAVALFGGLTLWGALA